MELIIKIGKTPERKIIDYNDNEFLDNCSEEVDSMEELLKEDDVTIVNATQFLVYTANNMVLRSIISGNEDLPEDLAERFSLKPENVKIIEVLNSGKEICIQGENGLLKENYFNKLMNEVMDDYYDSLSYYEPK